MVQHLASGVLWRVVVIVALLLGVLPSQATAASVRAVAETERIQTDEPVGLPPSQDFPSLSPDSTSTASASGSLTEDLLPQFSNPTSPSLLSLEELPPTGPSETEVAAPEGKPAPEPTVMLAPGSLSLTPDAYLLAAGQLVTVTVRVTADPGPSTAGATLKLELPPGLTLTGGQESWTLPDVAETPFAETVLLRAEKVDRGEVFKLSATLSQKGFADQTAELLLGGATGNELTVLLNPALAREGMGVAVESEWPVAGGQSAVSGEQLSVDSDESAVESGSAVYLPVVGGAGAGTQTDGEGFVRRWRIEARERDKPVQALTRAATILISTARLEADGVDVSQLRLWSREDENDRWRVVPARYLPAQQLFVAHTRHFSQWGLGGNLSASGELLPSVKSFAADGFTGYAQVSYPIETPSGLGGMNPGLSLSYSSGTPDDMENFNGTYDYEVQAGWAGHGWSLGGTSYIARNFANNQYQEYQLVLAGMGVEIRWNGSQWVTDPQQFLKIERIAAPGGYGRENMDSWVITTKNGAQYHFGSYQYDSYSEPIGNWTEVIFDEVYNSSQWEGVRTGSKWHLRVVVDPLGNRMEYDYDHETDTVGTCFQNKGWTGNDWSYDKATYLKEMRWSGNNTAGVSTKMKVVLTRETRPDWQVIGWNQSCVQARYADQRLKTVTVYAYDATSGGWPVLSQYILNYTQSQLHSLLTSVDRYGKNGTTLLYSYSFTYSGSWNSVRLSSANNGQGGSMSFSYGWEQIHDCYSCTQINWRSGLPQRRPVTQTTADDGNGAQAHTNYEYSGVAGHVTSGSFEYLGHSWSRAWRYTTDIGLGVYDRLEQREENWYRQRLNSSTIDPRRGRSYQEYIYAANGADMQHAHRQWNFTVQNGVHWVYQDWEHVYTFDWDGYDNWRGSWSYYFYESTYGNRIRVEQRASNLTTVLRKTETEYTFNTGLYIVDRPWRVRVYDGANNCASEVRHTYDSLMRLTRSDAPTTYCGENNAANLIQTNRSYDSVGNVTREWTTGTSHDIYTIYDPDFWLFAVRRYNASNSSLDETGKYYGVNGAGGVGNGLPVSDANGYWGRMQEFCGIDNICTQQAYDGFGRPTARWERSQGYPTVSSAQTRWFYYRKGEYGGNANIVLEWSLPRCYGNFSRKLYNGFGQLIQSQGPDENWTTNMDGCNPGTAGGEVVVDYAYDALGRQTRRSTPRSVPGWNWSTSAPWAEDWNNGYSETTYDALGRALAQKDPSGRTVNNYFSGLYAWSMAKGVGEGDRVASWSQQDDLGRTILLGSYVWTGAWTVDAQIQLSYDATDRLTKTERRDGDSGPWIQLSSPVYDFAGRKTSMNDADLGNWSYAYDKLGQLTRQTDARGFATCLAYNALGQVTSKTVYTGSGCSGGVAASYAYSYDSLGRLSVVNQTSGGSWSRSLTYDSQGRPSNETVTIDGISKTSTTYYDAYQRPYATRYPDNEVVQVAFNSLGLPKQLCRPTGDVPGNGCTTTYAGSAAYDVAGRLTAVQYPAGGNLWRTQTYHPWTTAKNGGLLNEIKVGTSNGGSDRFYRAYTYNSFGDVLNDGTGVSDFDYDDLGRLTSAYGENFTYDASNRMTSGGKSYNSSHPYHAPTSSNYGSYLYDSNGNMTTLMAGSTPIASFSWDYENRMAGVYKNGVSESYAYDADGNRIKKTSGSLVTRTFFPHYEEEQVTAWPYTTTAVKHYSFNGAQGASRIAISKGGVLSYVHSDHLGSSSVETDTSGASTASRSYYAYGSTRSSNGTLQTDRTYTGQKEDSTGLHFYNARYYDGALGLFLSPDTIVPDASLVIDYNRFLYTRANPLKYADPDGHCPAPPKEMGPTICVALFIKPERVVAGPVTVHGDGRDFSSNSDPEKSRGYIWISLNSDKIEAKLNPSLTIVPASVVGHEGFIWSEPSEANKWSVSHGEHGEINFEYDLVISGPLEKSGTAPHLNGVMNFRPDGKGGWDSSFTRDGFPWAEAYYHDGKGNVQTIFQDPAIRGNPHDLFAIEPKMSWQQKIVKAGQNLLFGEPMISRQ